MQMPNCLLLVKVDDLGCVLEQVRYILSLVRKDQKGKWERAEDPGTLPSIPVSIYDEEKKKKKHRKDKKKEEKRKHKHRHEEKKEKKHDKQKEKEKKHKKEKKEHVIQSVCFQEVIRTFGAQMPNPKSNPNVLHVLEVWKALSPMQCCKASEEMCRFGDALL